VDEPLIGMIASNPVCIRAWTIVPPIAQYRVVA
jgi:hypothetical protein